MIKSRKKFCLRLIAAVILTLITFGLTWEKLAKQQALIDFPATGKLIDIGGRNIHLDCRGQGNPTVIFESGLDTSGSLSWSLVHDEVAKTTRACAYDRAGMMWSDPRPNTEKMSQSIADDLNRALTISGEQPPYVLVGHSFGGPYITVFTKYFSESVAGLVLVDTSHPDQVTIMNDFKEPWINRFSYTVMDFFEPVWSLVGLTRVFAQLNKEKDTTQPDYDAQAIDAYAPISGETLTQESHAYNETLAEAGSFRDFGNRPLIVLGAIANFDVISDQELKEYGLNRNNIPEFIKRQVAMHNDQATWSTESEINLLYNTPHYIQFEKPKVVVNAVKSVIYKVRQRSIQKSFQ